MYKNILLIIFLFISTYVNAQNLRLLENFDKIPLSSQRFEIEGFMASFSEFKQNKINSTFDLPEKKYLAIEYSGENNAKIILFFNNGVLYLKRLQLNYPLESQNIAREEFVNLKKMIITNNVILSKGDGEITNKIYGSKIGESVTYYLTKSTKLYRTKSAEFAGILDFSYDKEKSTAKIVGYSVRYECTDLSKTILDAKTGYSSY